jgi:hypothetical protein
MKHVIHAQPQNNTAMQPIQPCLGRDEPRRRVELEAAAVIQIAGIALALHERLDLSMTCCAQVQ